MRPIEHFLTDLDGLKITLHGDGNQLEVKAPNGGLTPGLAAKIRANKLEILDFMTKADPQPYRGAAPLEDAHLVMGHTQQRLWFLEQLGDDAKTAANPNHLHVSLSLEGALDAEALRTATAKVVTRHASLRTSFCERDGKPALTIHPELAIDLIQVDLTAKPESSLKTCIAAQTARPFNLETDPLLRMVLIQCGSQRHVLLIVMHHLVSDDASMDIFVRELVAFYGEETGQAPASLPALPIHCADFSTWVQKNTDPAELDRQAKWWQEQLAGLPLVHQLQTDRPRPAIQTHRGSTYSETIPSPVLDRLEALAQKTGTTLFMVLLAGFKALLARHSGETGIVIGTPIANRNRREIEPLIGLFANTLVLRSQVATSAPFLDLLQQVKSTTLGAYAHKDVPFEHVVELLQPERHMSHTPLFQIMFDFKNGPRASYKLPALTIEPIETEVQSTRFDLTLNTQASPEGLVTSWHFNTDLFDQETIVTMASHFHHLLAAVCASPGQVIGRLDLLGPEERHKLLSDFNQTHKPFRLGVPIHVHIESHAQNHPNRIAVIPSSGDAMSYDVLNRRANRIAWTLIEHGIGPGSRVALFLDRCAEMIAAIVGILKTGAAYLPVDPEYPETRIAFMLEDGDPDLVLTMKSFAEDLNHPCVLRLDHPEAYSQREHNPNLAIDSLTSAYMIYTSGSTGRPKSSLNSHRGLSNHIHWLQDRFPLRPEDRVALKTPFSFDVSARETFWPLMAGASMVLAAPGTSGDPYYLQDWIRNKGITVCYFVGSMLQTFLESLEGETYASNLRFLFTGGESLPAESQRQILAQMIGQDGPLETQITYGPSEAAISCTHHSCGPEPRYDQLPIGKPIPNMACYVVDQALQLLPLGVPGELMISGENLSHGYHRRPSLTAARFLPNPFTESPGGRMYRTGDLVRHKPNGEILFIGRIDGQIKLRGMRIELGEIERRLMDHAAVEQGLVMMVKKDSGEPTLLAFYQHKGEAPEDLARTLWAFLAESLPAFMVPGTFVGLEAWPRLPNGKIDRHALQRMASSQDKGGEPEKAEPVPPRDPIETALAKIWCDVLGLRSVGVFDNFFEIGGHSLLTTQVLARMRGVFSETLPLRSLFAEPTIAGIAKGIHHIRQSAAQQKDDHRASRGN